MFSKLAPEMVLTKGTKWHLLCFCHDNSFAASPFLIKTEITSFCLYQGPSTSTNLLMIVTTIWEVCLFQEGPSVKKWGYLVFDRKRLRPREFPWQWPIWFLLWYTFLVPSLKNTRLLQYSRDILLFSILPF